jgi:hypothetical protein
MEYTYSFVLWPNEQGPWSYAAFRYFRTFRRRTEMRFTAAEFESFRGALTTDGFTVREVVRTPYVEPEMVL